MNYFIRFIMQVKKIPLHMNLDNGKTVLNGRWIGSSIQRRKITMTDSEIIEALSCCIKYEQCDKCPMYEKCEFSYDRNYVGVPDILPLSLDIIKRQKAKIDKLEHGIK